VKVKRGLFSCPEEEHLPGQNDRPDIKSPAGMQVLARAAFAPILDFPRFALRPVFRGK
jgi:hypothetical protein